MQNADVGATHRIELDKYQDLPEEKRPVFIMRTPNLRHEGEMADLAGTAGVLGNYVCLNLLVEVENFPAIGAFASTPRGGAPESICQKIPLTTRIALGQSAFDLIMITEEDLEK